MSDNQTPFATLGNAIGFVSKINGTVTVQSIDGQERVVKIGDPIFFGEIVTTGSNASVTIAFVDGTEVVIGGDAIVEMTDEIYNTGDAEDLVADSSTDVDALQDAILAGDDPTLIQEAPAAGEASDSVVYNGVSIDRVGSEGVIGGGSDTDYTSALPGFGYDTNEDDSQDSEVVTSQNTTRSSSSDTTTSDISVSQPTINLSASSDTGSSSSDLLTNDTSATFTLDNIDSDVVLVEIYNAGELIGSTTTIDGLNTFTADVGDLTEGENSLSIKVTDAAGNTSTSDPIVVTLDTTAAEGAVVVDAITSDDVINATEAAGTVAVSGAATGGDIAEDDTVTLVVNGTTYTTEVGENGEWSVDVAGSDLAADTSFDVVVTSSDDAGNTVTSTGTSTHSVDQSALLINLDIDQVTNDGVISAVEAAGTVTITGKVTGDDFESGEVTLVVNNVSYTAVFGSNGVWSASIAGSDLDADANKEIDASVVVTNNIGQEGTAQSVESYESDSEVIATLTDNGFTFEGSDSVFTLSLNQESPIDVTVGLTLSYGTANIDDIGSLSASYTDAGNTVVLNFNNDGTLTIPAGVTDITLNVSTIDDSVYEGIENFSLSVTGISGVTANDTETMVVIDNDTAPTISGVSQDVSEAEGDDLAFDVTLSNTADTAQTFAFSLTDGTTDSSDYGNVTFSNGVTYDAATGQISVPAGVAGFTVTVAGAEDTVLESDETFTLSVGGVESTGTIENDDTSLVNIGFGNGYAIEGSDVVVTMTLSAVSDIDVKVKVYTEFETADASDTGELTASYVDTDGVVQILAISEDGIIEIPAGITEVSLSVSTVDDSLVEGFETFTIHAEGVSGVSGTDTSTQLIVDNDLPALIVSISEDVNSDGYINANELSGDINVRVDLPDGVMVGQSIIVSDGDNSYSISVTSAVLSNGFVSQSFSAPDQGSTFSVTATLSDRYDNKSPETTVSAVVDTEVQSPAIDIAGDVNDNGIYSAAELGSDGTVTATISIPSDAVPGDKVTYKVGDNASVVVVLTTESIESGIQVEIAPDTTITATITDSAGNTSVEAEAESLSADISIATPSIRFESTGDDDVYNADELGDDGTITATISVAGSEVGDTLTYSVNGGGDVVVSVTQAIIDSGYVFEVSPGAEVTAILSDAAGNSSIEVSETAADADTSVEPPVITSVTDDSISSDYSKVTLHGTGEVGAVITLWVIANSTTDGNDTQTGSYEELTSVTTTVSSDGTWTLDVSDLSGSPVNDNEFFKVTQTDAAGNVSGDSNVVHYWHGDWTTIDSETGDDFVLLGSGNDTINVNADDASDSLNVDGGAGHDKAVFSAALSDMQSVTLDEDGNVIIVDNQGDTNTFIDFESFSFDGVVYTKEDLFAPHAEDDAASTTEDSAAITINVLENDSNVSGDVLTVTEATVPENQGTVVIVDGHLEFTPAENFNGIATIKYTVSDGHGGTDTAEVSVDVDAVNDAPVAAADTVTTDEDTVITIDVLANDKDVDGDILVITDALVPEEQGTVEIVNGKLQFTPAENFNGDATISYTISDGNGGTDSAEVKVTVESVNDAPVINASSGQGQGDEDSVGIDVTLSASDVDGTVASFVIKSLPVHGTLFIDGVEVTSTDTTVSATDGNASLTFVPDTDWSDNNGDAPVTFEYVAVDNSGEVSAGGTATINVTPVTDVPTVVLTLEPTTTTTLYSVDLSNVLDGLEEPVGNPAGFTVTAYNANNEAVDISIKDSGTPTGFGVTGVASNGSSTEIGKQEKLLVELDKPASSATFKLAWLNNTDETAVYTVKYNDGTSATYTVDGNSSEGGHDGIGSDITVNAPEGKSIVAVEFSTPMSGDRVETSDYLLHSVSYESSAMNYTVDITATPTDTDHSENITELTVTTPEGTSLSGAEKLGTENGVTTWKVSLNSGGFTNNIEIDSETGAVTVKGLILSVSDDFDGVLTVTATATANDPGAVDASGSATWENTAPEIVVDSASESVVVSEKGLSGDDSETVSSASATGIFNISDVDSDDVLTVSLVAPTEVMKSGGVTLIWTTDSNGDLVAKAGDTEIIRVALTDTDGQHGYIVTLSGPVDHADVAQEDTASINFGIDVNDGFVTTTESISVVIEDSEPVAVNDEASITVQRETFEVTNIVANWNTPVGGGNINIFDGDSTRHGGGLDDNDSGLDQIRWGDPADSSNLQSGYGFIDNDAALNGQFELNEDIILGTFTHYNYPVYEGGAISSASMDVAFKVKDNNGDDEEVSLNIEFSHNETTNTWDPEASKDIVTVGNTSVEFDWEGESYTLQVVGFKDANDPNSPVITSIHTAENAATSYELVVRIVEGSGYSLPEETGNVFDDNGLGADELSEDGAISVVGVMSGDTVTLTDGNVGQSIIGEYGNLVLNSDGSYVYEVTSSASNIPADATETFAYLIQDSDGSTSSANLTINVGTNTNPQAQDDGASSALFAGLVGEYYGTDSQINDINDFKALIENKDPDATFNAANINYGHGSGGVASSTHLQTFLGSDASTLSSDPSDNTDGGIYLEGYVYLEAGNYNFKVTADDGYQITIDDDIVAEFDHNQSSNTATHETFTVTESGYHAIDMIWWDQGGDYVFQPTLSSDGGETYFVLDASILSSTGEMPFTTLSEQGLEISVDSLLVNDTDADGDTLTMTSISNVQNGYAYMDSAGVIHFTPLQGFVGIATFDYSISDGKGGSDTATASISVTADGVLPTVSVSVSATNSLNIWGGFTVEADVIDNVTHQFVNYSTWRSFNDADDEVSISGNVTAWVDVKDGNNSVYIGGDISAYHGGVSGGTGNDEIYVKGSTNYASDYYQSSIQTGAGDDKVTIGVNSSGHIDLGSGDDELFIGNDSSGSISTGSGHDEVYIGDDVKGYINAGDGNDKLIVKGDVSRVSIELGSGNDFIVIEGQVTGNSWTHYGSWIDGGTGTDSIVLKGYTIAQYNLDVDNIKTRVVNFENIMLSDGVVKGDSSAFNSYSAAAFSYNVAVEIDNTNSTTESSIVTLFGIPLTASLTLAGEPLVAKADGSYDIEVTSNQGSIDDLIIYSDLELPDLDITSVVSFNSESSDVIGASPNEDNLLGLADDSYIIGTDINDTIIGGLGDDVLFGGDDQVIDTLTGGAGNDIFILNDTGDLSNIDIITDFNAAEDALDLTDLLVGIDGSPDKDADADAITEFLSQHVKVTAGNVKVDGEDVATFVDETSSFDSNNDGFVNNSDSVKIIYNNEEYNINIDG
ncbi:retention module-containing protein [Marinomonas rhizomae]|nr:retention module-containing protein [Marinomonas rhizomae]